VPADKASLARTPGARAARLGRKTAHIWAFQARSVIYLKVFGGLQRHGLRRIRSSIGFIIAADKCIEFASLPSRVRAGRLAVSRHHRRFRSDQTKSFE
jgi:hypothetical protein